MRVLVVEDVEEMAEFISQLLQALPRVKEVITAPNTGIARLELERRRPDVVFLDEVLPGESSRALLEDLVKQGIPTYLMTGTENAQRPLPEGALARIAKPGWKNTEEEKKRLEKLLDAMGN